MCPSPAGDGAADPRPLPRTAPPPPRSLETLLALGLCIVVVLGSIAVVETDRRISSALAELPVSRRASVSPDGPLLPQRTPPRLVCLISLGGLRADRLPPEDGGPSALGALAERAVTFDWVACQAGSPLVSEKALLCGDYPASLLLEQTGADLYFLASLADPRAFLVEAFARVRGTLPSGLRAAGYRTAAFACGPTTTRANGFGEGFDHFEEVAAGFATVPPRVRDWLATARDKPSFLFLETQELDGAGADAAGEYARVSVRLDGALHEVLEVLRSLGLSDEALIVLTSDHGTSLGERGALRSGDLYLEQVRVPLLVKFPSSWNVAPRHIDGPVELIDLLPTIFQACGLPVPRGLDGSSILPLIFRGVRSHELLVAQTSLAPGVESAARRTVIDPGRWQLIHDARTDEVLFFDLTVDPSALDPRDPLGAEAPLFVRDLLRPGREAVDASSAPAPGTAAGPPVR